VWNGKEKIRKASKEKFKCCEVLAVSILVYGSGTCFKKNENVDEIQGAEMNVINM
jgi:hypothetical protein